MTEVKEAIVELREHVQALEKRLESFASEHADFRAVHVSRRGRDGGRGEQGISGPAGPPADPKEVAPIAAELVKKSYDSTLRKFEQRFEQLLSQFDSEIMGAKAAIRWAVIEELKASGHIDAEGNAILKEGPAGRDGVSHVPGPVGPAGRDGVDGESIVGPTGCDGRDAKIVIGNVTSGSEVSVTVRHHEENGVHVFDFVLPRGERGASGPKGDSVKGDKGDRGSEGLQGYPGESGLSRDEVVELVMDILRRTGGRIK